MTRSARATLGFTLTELLVTLAIAGILAMIGAPAMARLLAHTRGASAEASIAMSLRHARTAAIMHNQRVVACPSANGQACDDSSEWQHGWIIADDADHDGQPDAGTPIIATFPAMSPGSRITTSAGRKRVAFHPNGSAAGSNASFTICNARSGDGEAVVVSNAGRVRESTPSAQRLQDCLAGLQ
ncbi:MAG TPA: GspH/FimT family pseudopilin [Rhodanobacteraceae bacterium]|jgi:type IV fimbrial biogenesis protein FimT|nr:GspH/FimT family pseudopilin [Rhodanobacteraceae bacterium]